ncbi:putative bifunctional diguanylate cyclase/phosphodiesterase [Sphingorhabdus arenilitoris]|uniref:Bifunctional diguanylate cyclase/phosphodiesterase n=1 Tax=Sphingorhabdus arenilitoris TaxID=1490041 RepID=A0ABV8RH70_9SPHN
MLRHRAAIERLAQFTAGHPQELLAFIIGIRDLKQINDRFGRSGGDGVIRKVGARLRKFASAYIEDTLFTARLPGREFLIVAAGGADRMEIHAEALIDILSSDFGKPGAPVHISTRIGIAVSGVDESGEALLQRAQSALAKAYSRKGRRYVIAEYHHQDNSKLAAALDADLRSAIEKRQITIMLQPQFAVANGALVGAEALARWHHPKWGEISADTLFSAADRCDLREELSHVIQQEAIAIAANWPAALDALRLSVNLGAEELTEGYAARLMGLLDRTGFAPQRLTVELTEESLVRDADRAGAELERLRGQGIKIALDDFGTGYSSLAYLKDLPLDYLKIDKGMTPDIAGISKDRIILRAIIAMGKALGLMIIAEGVEKAEELEMLQAELCDYFQGYLRSAPLSADDFERFALRSD